MGAEEQQQQEADQKPRSNRTSTPTSGAGTLTESQFLSWKCQKDAAASTRKADASRKRAEDLAAGTVQMNGRELFLHEPWVFDNTLY